MASVLSEYEVAALSPGDKVFIPSGKKNKKAPAFTPDLTKQENTELDKKVSKLNSSLRKLYEKIPQGKSISQEFLVSEEFPMRELMRALLKLELAGLITMLPGEMLKRN